MESNISIHRYDEQRNLYKTLFDAYKCDKIILDTYGDTVTLKRRRDDANKDEEPSAGSDKGSKRRGKGKEPESTSKQKKPLTPDRAWNKTLTTTHKSIQPWISDLAKQADSRSSFNELMDTHVDFSAFLINRLKVDTLTPELLVGPTYELMKGSCKSLVELEFFLEEVYKIMGTSSGLKTWYLTQCRVKNRSAMINMLSGESLIGGANVNSSMNLQSTGSLLEIDDDKLYKFKEGNFKRLHIQDIKDMLLFLVQGKLSNLTVEECFAFNVSLRMFTRSIVIQRRLEDLQLDKQNRLTRINELHKFSVGTLDDVQTALDDRLKAKDEEDHAKSGKFHWWEIVRRRLQDAITDHMICRMMSLSYRVKMEILLEPTSNKLMLVDIKEMKDVFDSPESAFNATWKHNELLNDQLLKAKLNHEITSANKRKDVETNQNAIALGMYKVNKQQEPNTIRAKSVLPSTGLSAASSVSRPLNGDSPLKNSILFNTKKSSKKVEVFVRTNKKTYVTSKNVVSYKKIITDVDVQNSLKAKDVLCVSCAKNVLILCHDKFLVNYKLNVHSKVKRALFTTPRTATSAFVDTTP
nr:hypothetical protein [Tanacetum cinerariifolium]